jgi:uncharacterized protein (TIGR03083 family)
VTPAPAADPIFFARCGELDEMWATWAATLRTLSVTEWSRPTRLPGWDVAALVAHHSMFPASGVPAMLQRRRDDAPTMGSAAELLRRFNEPDGAATRLAGAVEEQARAVAGTIATDELVRRFSDVAPSTIAAVRDAGPIVVDYFGHATLALRDALTLAVLEATVHLLDLLRALDRPPDVPAAGLHTTVVLLAELAPRVEFVEAATGRSAMNPLPVLR